MVANYIKYNVSILCVDGQLMCIDLPCGPYATAWTLSIQNFFINYFVIVFLLVEFFI